MAKIPNLPVIKTEKGEFYVKNYMNSIPTERGVTLYDEELSFVTSIPGFDFKENDPISVEELKLSIEGDDSI